MYKTILIPTDFTVESLNLVKQSLIDHQDEKINIILVHCVNMSNTITDLLFFSKNKIIEKLSQESFQEGCSILINRFSDNINSFRKELFSGYNQSAFNNFIEANQIDKIYIPEEYEFKFNNEISENIMPYIKKTNLKKVSVNWESLKPSSDSNTGGLAQLFQI